jgi:16S rRNA G527 N7-methylase RsmG
MFHVEHFLPNIITALALPPNCSKNLLQNLQYFKQEYFKWIKAYNISSIKNENDFWVKHVVDSLCLASVLKLQLENNPEKHIYDLGSGAGLPGLVLSMVYENPISMHEPVEKKADFISHVLRRGKLEHGKADRTKYEDINYENNSIIVTRALSEHSNIYEVLSKKCFTWNIFFMITEKTQINLPEGVKYIIHDEPYKLVESFDCQSLSGHRILEVQSPVSK